MTFQQKIQSLKYSLLLYGLFVFIIYLSGLNNSRGYEWDASNIASWANRGMFIVYHQQGHLLQSILNMIWCNLWKFFGYNKDCLMPLRVLSCIFGAAGVVGFFILLDRIFKLNIIALFGSLGLAFSVFYWGFSTDLETHLLPASVFIYCLLLLFSLDKLESKKIILLSFLHSICIYLSGIYIFFTPAIIMGIMTIRDTYQNRYKALILYFFNLMLFWFLPFLIIGLYFYKINPDFRYADSIVKHIFIWFRGFEKLVPFEWINLAKAMLCYFRAIHYITPFSKLTVGLGIITFIFYIGLFLTFIKNSKYIINNFLRVILIAFMIIIPYQLVLLVYEPFNVQRYTHFLSAFWLLITSLAYPFFMSKKALLVMMPFIFIGLIFCVNLIFYIYPRHRIVLLK